MSWKTRWSDDCLLIYKECVMASSFVILLRKTGEAMLNDALHVIILHKGKLWGMLENFNPTSK